MQKLYKELDAWDKELSILIRQLRARLKNTPKERVVVSTSHGFHQYYFVPAKKNDTECGQDTISGITRRYARKSEMDRVRKLVQRDYEQKLLKAALYQQDIIRCFLRTYDPGRLSDIYDFLNPGRKMLVKPWVINDEEFARNWQAEEYAQMEAFSQNAEYWTVRGERVRSKSEKMIADSLYQHRIPYQYEYPLQLQDGTFLRPDFRLLKVTERKVLYWEHMGMMDNPDYMQRALKKIETYERNGFFPGEELILTHEVSERPLSTTIIEETIRHYLL